MAEETETEDAREELATEGVAGRDCFSSARACGCGGLATRSSLVMMVGWVGVKAFPDFDCLNQDSPGSRVVVVLDVRVVSMLTQPEDRGRECGRDDGGRGERKEKASAGGGVAAGDSSTAMDEEKAIHSGSEEGEIEEEE